MICIGSGVPHRIFEHFDKKKISLPAPPPPTIAPSEFPSSYSTGPRTTYYNRTPSGMTAFFITTIKNNNKMIVSRAFERKEIKRLYCSSRRPERKPLPLHCYDVIIMYTTATTPAAVQYATFIIWSGVNNKPFA